MISDGCSLFHVNMPIVLLIAPFVHDCMKVVSLNHTMDEMKPQRSPPSEAEATERPATPPPPHTHQDKTTAHETPEVNVTC